MFLEKHRSGGGATMRLGIGMVLAAVIAIWWMMYFWKDGEKEKAKVIFVVEALLLGGWLVYGAFYFQVGFPAGEGLSSSDWLSFLGGYLGFAGSLIMAWLVYLQDTRLKELTLEEYAAEFYGCIRSLKWIDRKSLEREPTQVVIFCGEGEGKGKSYFKHEAFLKSEEKRKDTEEKWPVIFLSLKNAGKLSVKNICFEKIEIQSYDKDAKRYTYGFQVKNEENLMNGKHEILPGGALNICLVMHSLPEELKFSSFRLTFGFKIGKRKQEQELLFYIETKGKKIIQISDGETVFEIIRTNTREKNEVKIPS